MYNAFGLVDGSDVRVAGVNVGTITDLTVNAGKRAVVTIEVEGDLARFGDETTCESSPQSLIAEYFLDCQPAGEPLARGRVDPRQPGQARRFSPTSSRTRCASRSARRLTLLINEFGTALAGNPENLREAIRLGAPALTEFEQVTRDPRQPGGDDPRPQRPFGAGLARAGADIASGSSTSSTRPRTSPRPRSSAARTSRAVSTSSTTTSHELRPTLAQLNDTARQQTPLLADLREAAPELHRLSVSLPIFQRASEDSLALARRGRRRRPPRAAAGATSSSCWRRRAGRAGDGGDARRLPARPRRPAPRGRDQRPRRGDDGPHRASSRGPATRRATPASRGSSTTPTTRPSRSTSSTASGTRSTSTSTSSRRARAGASRRAAIPRPASRASRRRAAG